MAFTLGQSWSYEHLERPLGHRLGGHWGLDPDPVDPAFPFVALVVAVIAVVVAVTILSRRRGWGGRSARAVAIVALVVVGTTVCTVLVRTDWLKDAPVSDVCWGYPGRPPRTGVNKCAPEHLPASGWWLIAGLLLAMVAMFAATSDRRTG